MKKNAYFLTFGLLLLLATSLQAQKAPRLNQIDAKGRKQGEWKKIDSSALSYTGQFKDDRPYGRFVYTDGRGRVAMVSDHFRGGYACFTRFYDTTGMLRMDGYYLDQLRDSVWRFYNPSGLILKEERYEKGLLHGIAHLWDRDSTLIETTTWFRGLRNGIWWEKSEKGTQTVPYKLNLSHGLYEARYPDGNLQITGNYVDGLKQGAWDFMDENRRLEKRCHFKENVLVKKEVALWSQGQRRLVDIDTVAFLHTNGTITEVVMLSGETVNSDVAFARLSLVFDTEFFFFVNPQILASFQQVKDYEEYPRDFEEDPPKGILHLKGATPYDFILDEAGLGTIKSLLNRKTVEETP